MFSSPGWFTRLRRIMWGNQSVGDARTTHDSAFSFMLFRIHRIYRQKHTKTHTKSTRQRGETKHILCREIMRTLRNWQMKIVVSSQSTYSMDGPFGVGALSTTIRHIYECFVDSGKKNLFDDIQYFPWGYIGKIMFIFRVQCFWTFWTLRFLNPKQLSSKSL